MLVQLLRFEITYQSKQKALLIFTALFFFFGVFMGGLGQAPAQVDFNSAYKITNSVTLFSLGSVFIIMFFAISGVIRDKKHQMEALIFCTSIKKKHYFWSRYIGTLIFSILGFSLFLPGFIVGLFLSDLDPTRVASFKLQSYLWPFLVIIIPNFFICTTLIFSVSILSKNNIATYASAILIYILYFLVSFYSNSPVMAASIPASPESMVIAAIIDPFTGATFYEHTQFWTPYDKNNLPFSFSRFYLKNRVLWIGISCILLAITYRVFSFRKPSQKVRKKQYHIKTQTEATSYFSATTQSTTKAQWMAFWSSFRIDSKGVFKSLPFLVIVLTLLSMAILELYSRIFEGGSYGDSWYPFTNLLIEIVMELVPILSLILIVFYSGELIWRARDKKMDSLLHTTPTLNWVFFLSKLVTLTFVPMLLIALVIIVCICFQLANGYFDIDLKQYLSLFYYYGTSMFVYAMVGIFIQSVIHNKFLGMGITGFVFLFLGSSLSSNIGIEHPMLRIGSMPIPMYSNMTGYSIQSGLFDHYAVYWIAFGAILSVLSFKLWKRVVSGSGRFRESVQISTWKRWEIGGLIVAITVFTVAGSYIYYQTNIKLDYTNANDRQDYAEQYERNFKQYDSIPRLHYAAIKTNVDLFPSEETYTVKAEYTLINKNEIPVHHLFISERKILSDISVGNAKLVWKDTIYGTYLFEFNRPILPQETATLQYALTKTSTPYQMDRAIVKNGTYIRHEAFEPVLGYHSSRELSNPFERQRRGLPEQVDTPKGDTHLRIEKAAHGDIMYETIVSTDSDQKALAAGNLISTWQEHTRNYYHYKFPNKNIPSLAYFSAVYDVKQENHKGISLEYYYHPGHDINHHTIDTSTKATLAYCTANFGNYPFDHLRIAEIPSYHPFGGAAHPGLINMVEDNLYLIDIRDTNTFDLVSKRTIHEVAHQWWGLILTPKNVEGAAFITEGFAKYTESVVLEKLYGKGALWELNKQANRRYFNGRAFASVKEPPVYLQDNESYLSYGKSILVIQSIKDLIGEDTLNTVLQELIATHATHSEYNVHTLELIDRIYEVTPDHYHGLINEWMKQIIRYDLKVENTSHTLLKDGTYEVTFDIKAKRFKTLENGSEKKIDIDEPIYVGLFSSHPKDITKDDTPIYLQPHRITKESTTVTIIVNELPSTISIDPFLTRIDNNYVDNLKEL